MELLNGNRGLTHHGKVVIPQELIYLCRIISGKEFTVHNLDDKKAISLIQSHRLISPIYKVSSKISNPILKAQLDQLYLLNKMEQLKLCAELIRLQLLFKEQNIPFLTFKGPLLSQLLHQDPAERTSLDLDLLIEKTQVDSSIKLLTSHGYRVLTFYNSPKQFKALLKYYHHIVLYHDESGIKLELHWDLTSIKSFPFDTSSLISEADSIHLGTIELLQMNRVELFKYLCVHGAIHGFFRLQWLIDCYFFLSNLEETERKKLLEQVMQDSFTIPVMATLRLIDILMGVQFATVPDIHRKVNKLVKVSLVKIARSEEFDIENSSLSFAWMRMISHVKIAGLLEGPRGFFKALVGRNVRPENWRIFAFPDSLFFLNHLFSRFIWLYGKLFAKKYR